MKNIISYSLFGSKPMYLRGAVSNAKLAKYVYPGWVCRFYVDDTVPADTVDLLRNENAEIIVKSRNRDMYGMAWRFEPASDMDVKYFVVRDVDDRLTFREKCAVDDWIASEKLYHVMRDHPNHRSHVMGGMWGGISGSIPEFTHLLDQYASSHGNGFWWDMQFLEECLWDTYIKGNCLVHDEFWRPTGTESTFPKLRERPEDFVGQKYDEFDHPVYSVDRI